MSPQRRHILLAITVLVLLTIGLQSCGSKDDPPPPPPDTVPSAPAGVTVTSGDGEATISWDSVSGAASYSLYMAETTGVTKTSNTMTHTNVTSPFTHTGLTNGTTYSFVVTAVNSAGESAESSEISVTPTANNGPSPFSITLPTTSTKPLIPLRISTIGLSQGKPVSLIWSDGLGFLVKNEPIRVEQDGTVVAAVPFYVDPSTNEITQGTISLVLTQENQSSPSATLTIENLPQLNTYGIQLGQISHSFLIFRTTQLARRIGQLQSAQLLLNGTVDTLNAQSTLKSLLNATIKAQSDVDHILLDNATVISDTLPDSTPIRFDQYSQDLMDRILGLWLSEQFINLQSFSVSTSLSSTRAQLSSKNVASFTDLSSLVEAMKKEREMLDVIKDISKATTSENGLDYLHALIKGSADFLKLFDYKLPGNDALFGKQLGTGLAIFDILHATLDSVYDLGTIYIESKYGGDPEALAQAYANMNNDTIKAFNSSLNSVLSPVTLGFLSAVPPDAPASFNIIGLNLALADAYSLLELAGLADETTLNVAANFQNPFPSPSQGIGEIQGTVSATNLGMTQSSLDLCCFGANQLGIIGLTDDTGKYAIPVPFSVAQTDYSNLSVTASDPINGTTIGSATVDLSGVNTGQTISVEPIQIQPPPPGFTPVEVYKGSGTGSGTLTYPNQLFPSCVPEIVTHTQTFYIDKLELDVDHPLLVAGGFSGIAKGGQLTATLQAQDITCFNSDGTSYVIPGFTDTRIGPPLPGLAFYGTSDGTDVLFDDSDYSLDFSDIGSCTAPVIATLTVEPVTGNVHLTISVHTECELGGGALEELNFQYNLIRQQ